MKIKVVILSHDTPQTSKALYDLLNGTFDVTVFNVGSGEGQSPHCPYELYPNLYYTGCWREAMQRFGDYDVLWVIGGDVMAQNTAKEYRDAIESFYPFGLWSPTFVGYSREVMQYKYCRERVLNVYHLEGITLAMSKEMMAQINWDVPLGNKLGWGVDIWMCWSSWTSGMTNVLDGRVSMFHPEKCGYSRKEANLEMMDFIEQVIGDGWEDELRMASHYGVFDKNIRGVIL